MKILIVSQYFPPEIGAGSTRVYETAKLLRKFGNEVSVLTAFPNYMLDEPVEKYKDKFSYFEEIDGIKIYRSYIYLSFKKQSLFIRFCGFLSFMISSIIKGIKLKNFDVIIATSPPFSIGISGLMISRIKGSKLVFEVRDLYPDSAVELGIVNNSFLIKILKKAEKIIYSRSNLIVALTKGIYNHFKILGFEPKSILITNGVDKSFFNNYEDYGVTSNFDIKNKFILLNIGILGRIHSLETILDSFYLIKEKDIFLFFIGDGVEEENLKLKAKNLKLKNMLFIKSQKRENIRGLISKSDVCLATTKKIGLTRGTLPVKIFEYMACEKPVIAAVHGEVADLIKKAKAGIVVEPENSELMADAILTLYNNPDLRKEMGRNGRDFVMKNYSREKIVELFEKELKKLIGK